MKRQHTPVPRRGSDQGPSDQVARFLAAVAMIGGDATGTELAAVVAATGLSWAEAVSVAGRLRRDGRLASLPRGRLILSARGRAAVPRA